MDDLEIFKLLVLLSDRCRKLDDPSGFKFYIAGMQVHAYDVLQVLPLKKDKTLAGYHNRMAKEFSDYCLVCDELLQVNAEKQALLTEFTDALYQHVGFPNRFSEMGLYLGNYKQTPFGVHVDSCGVFSFPVVGQKSFRIWTNEFAQKHPELDRAFDYDDLKKHSVVLKVKKGDMSYWPSSAWHIAESDGSFNATWSLGVWVDQSLSAQLAPILMRVVDQKQGEASYAKTTTYKKLNEKNGEVKTLPPAYEDFIKKVSSLTETELRQALLDSWTQHISTRGFKTPTANDDELTNQSTKKISRKSKITLANKSAPILWRKTKASNKTAGKMRLSFAGVTIQTALSSELEHIVKTLALGKPVDLSKAIKTKSANGDFKVLQRLLELGAIVIS